MNPIKKKKAIYYLSKKFTSCEINCIAIENTCSALAWASHKLRPVHTLLHHAVDFPYGSHQIHLSKAYPSNTSHQKCKASRDWHHPLHPMLFEVLKLQQICKPSWINLVIGQLEYLIAQDMAEPCSYMTRSIRSDTRHPFSLFNSLTTQKTIVQLFDNMKKPKASARRSLG